MSYWDKHCNDECLGAFLSVLMWKCFSRIESYGLLGDRSFTFSILTITAKLPSKQLTPTDAPGSVYEGM